MNFDGTLVASVHQHLHCVYIYRVVDLTAAPIIVGTAGTAGRAHGQLNYPVFACFVLRNGADTLLICDPCNDRVVEVTASGDFLRAIAVKAGSWPSGVAYCSIGGVIAVSLSGAHAVVLLQYESGAVKPEVTIGTGAHGSGDGQLWHPHGVTFTIDGRHILVSDYYNDRVSKFNVASGAFIAHVVSNRIRYPGDVVQCEDGIILVTVKQWRGGSLPRSLVCVGADDETVQTIIIPKSSGGAFIPYSVSYSPSLHGVVVKTLGGKLFLLCNAWMHSSRCAWLSALSFS